MARLLADINFPRGVVLLLRTPHGHDVELLQAVQGTSRPEPAESMTDVDVARFATERKRIVLSCDHDFAQVHAAFPGHYGIVICKEATKDEYRQLARQIDTLLKRRRSLAGQLFRLPASKE